MHHVSASVGAALLRSASDLAPFSGRLMRHRAVCTSASPGQHAPDRVGQIGSSHRSEAGRVWAVAARCRRVRFPRSAGRRHCCTRGMLCVYSRGSGPSKGTRARTCVHDPRVDPDLKHRNPRQGRDTSSEFGGVLPSRKRILFSASEFDPMTREPVACNSYHDEPVAITETHPRAYWSEKPRPPDAGWPYSWGITKFTAFLSAPAFIISHQLAHHSARDCPIPRAPSIPLARQRNPSRCVVQPSRRHYDGYDAFALITRIREEGHLHIYG